MHQAIIRDKYCHLGLMEPRSTCLFGLENSEYHIDFTSKSLFDYGKTFIWVLNLDPD